MRNAYLFYCFVCQLTSKLIIACFQGASDGKIDELEFTTLSERVALFNLYLGESNFQSFCIISFQIQSVDAVVDIANV